MDTELQVAINYCTENGKKIGEQAAAGNQSAKNIIIAYDMVYKSPSDPGSQVLLIERIKEYRR
jgi:hypothetical protein